jgi:hypothetical protein
LSSGGGWFSQYISRSWDGTKGVWDDFQRGLEMEISRRNSWKGLKWKLGEFRMGDPRSDLLQICALWHKTLNQLKTPTHLHSILHVCNGLLVSPSRVRPRN